MNWQLSGPVGAILKEIYCTSWHMTKFSTQRY